jgi:hypothetical protein
VRDTTRQLPDGFHLLRLPQLLLRLLARGNFLQQFAGAFLDTLFERGRQISERRTLSRELRHEFLAFDFRDLASGDIRRDANQRCRPAVESAKDRGMGIDPTHRSIAPDRTIFDVVVVAVHDGGIECVTTGRTIVGMNRLLHFFQCQRLIGPPSKE